jgi:hypothetical protein
MIAFQYVVIRKEEICLVKFLSTETMYIHDILEIHYVHSTIESVAHWKLISLYKKIVYIQNNTFGMKNLLKRFEQKLDNFSFVKDNNMKKSSLIWRKFKKKPNIQENNLVKYRTCEMQGDEIKKYPQLSYYLEMLQQTKAVIVKNLSIENDLSLDWNEDFSSIAGESQYGLLIVEGDLEVSGNITNFGNGGLILLVLGDTKAKNLMAMESIVILNTAKIENLTLAAFEHGALEIESLETKLLVNLSHSVEIKNKEKIQYTYNQEDNDNEKRLAKCFMNNKLLSTLVYEETEELQLAKMATIDFFSNDLKSVVNDIIRCLNRFPHSTAPETSK